MAKLVNLGSLCIDNVYRVPNLTGAGETVSSLSHQVVAGGKGLNQSLAAARAGARVQHFGCVGADGGKLLEVLRAAGVDADGVRMIETAASGHAVIQVDDAGANAIVIAGGANRALAAEDLDRAFAALEEGDWLLLQNEVNNLEGILERAAGTRAQIAFNVAPVDGREDCYDLAAVNLLIVNEIEAAALAGDGATDDPARTLDKLRRRLPDATVVLTLGAAGLWYAEPDAAPRSLPAFAVEAVDETAAGDAFIGYLMAGLLAGEGLELALQRGAAAGALAVMVPGAASSIPAADAVARLLSEKES